MNSGAGNGFNDGISTTADGGQVMMKMGINHKKIQAVNSSWNGGKSFSLNLPNMS